jgi:hypothetical protein
MPLGNSRKVRNHFSGDDQDINELVFLVDRLPRVCQLGELRQDFDSFCFTHLAFSLHCYGFRVTPRNRLSNKARDCPDGLLPRRGVPRLPSQQETLLLWSQGASVGHERPGASRVLSHPGSESDTTALEGFAFALSVGVQIYGDKAYNHYGVEDVLRECGIELLPMRKCNAKRTDSALPEAMRGAIDFWEGSFG